MPSFLSTRFTELHPARRFGIAASIALSAACTLIPHPGARSPVPRTVSTFSIAGQFSILPLGRFPPVIGLEFGGISGIVSRAGGTELLGISDAHNGTRVYRFKVEGTGSSFRVTPVDVIPFEMIAGVEDTDPESLVVLPNGGVLVASEGIGSRQPRLAPALTEFGPHGEFLRQLDLRMHFVPTPNGTIERGVRQNEGFESLAISPDRKRIYTAVETSLVQDGPAPTFEAGARSRILEYVARHDTYVPAREFVYEVDPVVKPPFAHGFFINGLVELLVIDGSTLLALERGYVEEAGGTGRNMNKIRLYRVTLTGATDVSGIESLAGQTRIVPVTKTLLVDLGDLQGLDPALLATALDNFEGMAPGPRLPDGRQTLILVSDDNFNKVQRTWFLMLAIN